MSRRIVRLPVALVLLLGAATSRARADDAADERLEFARALVARGAERKVEAPDFGAKSAWLNAARPALAAG